MFAIFTQWVCSIDTRVLYTGPMYDQTKTQNPLILIGYQANAKISKENALREATPTPNSPLRTVVCTTTFLRLILDLKQKPS